SPGVLVKTTLRSGRVVKHAGHVVVIGDVNPGAQVIAGGDVLVWGRLRGTVHAGANGDTEALVCALDMRPMQLRIANYVAIASDNGEPRPRPEIASVRDGQIVSEEWGV
ncbi:MAG TPA: septum site-determining protein MinC, partial [Aggregatilineales bacterium]|nr:septum site-determining protein MinC [Aggregatilineales bacterium]